MTPRKARRPKAGGNAGVTVAERRSLAEATRGTRAAREALATARSLRKIDALRNPACQRCGGPTVQNAPERTRGTYWCSPCRAYGDGSSGFAFGRSRPVRPPK